jgi:sugar phosphate isomerase/epimerase
MSKSTLAERLAVCSWSLQPTDPQDLASKIKSTNVLAAQLALDPLRESPAIWGQTGKVFQAHDIAIVSGMFGCVGEDYSTMDKIRLTGGLAPDATWEQNRKNIAAAAEIAAALGLRLVTFHAGFLPHDESSPDFNKMLNRLATVGDLFEEKDVVLGLETGQETADALATFLEKLERPNVGVNFDPANMVLYDNGDPAAALRTLGPWLRQVHIKDAVRTKTPGTWGEEVPVGTGDVRWKEFFATLQEVGYQGPLVIEREAGTQRVADVRTARSFLEKEFCQNE